MYFNRVASILGQGIHPSLPINVVHLTAVGTDFLPTFDVTQFGPRFVPIISAFASFKIDKQ